MSRLSTFALRTVGCASLLFLGACTAPRYIDSEPGPADAPPPPTRYDPSLPVHGVSDASSAPDVQDALTASIGEFAELVAARAGGRSVGVLPLGAYTHTTREPQFTDLSEDVANRIAYRLRSDAGMGGLVTDIDGMRLRLSRCNVERHELVSVEALGERAGRLGLDVVVYGTIRENRAPGLPDSMTVSLRAWDVLGLQSVASKNVEVRRDASARRLWTLLERESLWQDATWDTPNVERPFDSELDWMAEQIAIDVERAVVEAGGEYSVAYVAPTATSAFHQGLWQLRAAQRTWSQTSAERAVAGDDADPNAPMVINGIEFPDPQAALSYLNDLRESLHGSPAADFGRSVTNMIAGKLRPRLAPREVKMNDIGFTDASDTALVEGELATGGLVSSKLARQALQDGGIDLVVAPRLEELAGSYLLRVEVFDLPAQALVGSTYWRIEPRYYAAISEQLDLGDADDLAPVPEDDRGASGTSYWATTFERVVSGVARVDVPGGSGTGFLIDERGFLLTNYHVVAGAVDGTVSLRFRDGARVTARVVNSDAFWDAAVLRIDGDVSGRHVFQMATGASVGIDVALIGHPKSTDGWVLSTGTLSSVTEELRDSSRRPSYMYSCPTREGSSGSPVFDSRGRVIALHSHGSRGSVDGPTRMFLNSELTGFALGAPGSDVSRFLQESLPRR